MEIMNDDSSTFDFPEMLETKYGLSGHNIDGTKRVIFRGNRSTKDIKKMFIEKNYKKHYEIDHLAQQDLFCNDSGFCGD